MSLFLPHDFTSLGIQAPLVQFSQQALTTTLWIESFLKGEVGVGGTSAVQTKAVDLWQF